MEELVNKFIEEGEREHEKMNAFIREFRTTSELLLKERNNSLSELEFEVYGLLRAINKAQMVGYEAKGVTTKKIHNRPQSWKRLRKEKEEAQQRKFLENLKQLHINIPFTKALAQMPKYAKFLKCLLSNKARLKEACMITMNERCSAVLLNKLPSKEKDPGSFTIPCDIGHLHIDNALADLGGSISLMPYTMYEKLGLGELKPTRMSLELADRSIQYSRGIAEDITLRVGSEEVIFNVNQSMKKPNMEDDECYGIDDLDTVIQSAAQELLENKNLEDDIIRPNSENHRPDSEIPIRLINHINTSYPHETHKHKEKLCEHLYSASAIEINKKKPELKDLPSHLEYIGRR
ncbi:DNA-directed DNA polymerase [Tanacetum coccineum]